MNHFKILTDTKIDQSENWRKSVTYISATNPLEAFFLKHNKAIYSTFKILLNRDKFNIVITEDIKTAQLFGIVRTLLKLEKPKHIVLELMLDEECKSVTWFCKRYLQRLCFSSTDVIYVSSKHEVEAYADRLNLDKDRIKYLPFHTNIIIPEINSQHNDYIFSAGRSGRDFRTLAAAVCGINLRVVVVSDKISIEGVNFPPNVELFIDIPRKEYIELLKHSRVVVIPLKKLVRSTGQVVMLEAMALGKPVIATDTIGTADYICDGSNGLLVEPGNSESLRLAIVRLIQDQNLTRALTAKAFERIVNHHTFETYVDEILGSANKILSELSD